jgi:hypothetical protein
MFQPCKINMDHSDQNRNFNLSKATAPVEGHVNQQRIHARSTKIKEEEDCDNEAGTALDNGLKTHCVYPATMYAVQIYTYQTGQFHVVSNKGNKFIMVLYEYEGNAIMAEPIKHRTSTEILRAF